MSIGEGDQMERRALHRSTEENKRLILRAAARLFVQSGYTAATLRQIAKEAGINIGSLMYAYETKESILVDLVKYVLNGQFAATEKLLQGVTDDKVLFWAVETTLQLHMAESRESIREIYLEAYSHQKSAGVIYQVIAEKMQAIFQAYHPQYEAKDFYELEIASGGIIRSYMSVPCDIYFTMNRKVRRYLEISFMLYNIPAEKTREAIEFVSRFDFTIIAQQVIESLLAELEQACAATENAVAEC